MIVVYQSFEGQYSDSPRALYQRWRRRRPDDTHVWLAADAYADAFPSGVETVPIYSADGLAALEAADVLIASTHTDTDWVKRPGAFYLQTWHGTPLKRIHNDVRWAPEGRLARLDLDVARWDALLSPNPVSTGRMRDAFAFPGPIWETGYPRNDLLSSPRAESVRRRVRGRLSIPPDMTAVLYTPTWRDDHVFSGAEGPTVAGAALPAVLDRLPADQVLLFRCHSFDAARHLAATDPRVRDVSFHPDVAELYLAADAMITDYSSTMFDFAITGKPLLHFVPDHERFRDEVRGFYVDLAAEAPGPLLSTPDELGVVLRRLGEPDPAYARRYAEFRQRYCSLEDGHATDRVLAALAAAISATPAASATFAGSPVQ